MNYDIARQQHIAWLKGQIDEKKVAQTEAEEYILQLRSEIAYFEKTLEQVADKLLPQRPEPTVTQGVSNYPKNVFAEQRVSAEKVEPRSPKEMLRSEFSDKTLGEVILLVLNSCHKTVNIDDAAQIAFETQDDDEYGRARNSLSTELRRGAKEGKWKQVGRGLFAANGVPEADLSNEFEEEYNEAKSIVRKTIAEHSKIEHSAEAKDGSVAELAPALES